MSTNYSAFEKKWKKYTFNLIRMHFIKFAGRYLIKCEFVRLVVRISVSLDLTHVSLLLNFLKDKSVFIYSTEDI